MSTGKKISVGACNDPLDEQALVTIATEAFMKELGLEDDTLLRGGHVQIREIPGGTYLMKEESQKVRRVSVLFQSCFFHFVSLHIIISKVISIRYRYTS
jgi:hypothetical protein